VMRLAVRMTVPDGSFRGSTPSFMAPRPVCLLVIT
jgi:hypothetical protein